MKVLVTGGGGFLGQTICKQLVAAGHTVCAFNRNRYPALDALKVEQRVGDIANLDSVTAASEDVDAIVHSAGKVGAWGRLEDYYEANVRGTDNVLASCELHKIDKLVFTSSPSVVHGGGDLDGVNESAPYASHFSSAYAQTKALAEQRVLAANGQSIPASAPALELNVAHPLIRYMDGLKEPEPFAELASLMFDQASLADEGQIANGADFARRLNKLLVRLVDPGVVEPSTVEPSGKP